MKCTIIIIVILILTISPELAQTKEFSCVNKIGSDCAITSVTMKDMSIKLANQNPISYQYNYNYGQLPTLPIIDRLTILNSSMDEILPITSESINLKYLSCVGCGLADITRHSFTHSLSNLVTLDISVGSFATLHKKLFGALTSVTHLNVSHGIVSEIDDTAFFNLAKLQFLYLSNNNISKITPNMFAELSSLFHLDMSFNHIDLLHDGLFANNTKLNYLNLAHNDITTIDGRLFDHQLVPHYFDLSDNYLTTLDAVNANAEELHVNRNRLKQISVTNKMKVLMANHNVIEDVICDEEGDQLNLLSITNNSLSTLGCVSSLSQLTKLYLDDNNLAKLNQSSFAALTLLTELHLKSANISKLEYGVFSHQEELRFLDISYNQINLAIDILLAARNLQSLYIDGNNISEFSYNDLRKTFPDLHTIGIGDNNFNCSFLGQVIRQLNNDNISTTNFGGDKVTNIHNLNGIRCIVTEETSTLPWITEVTTNDNVTSAIIQHVKKLSEEIRTIEQQNYKTNDDILSIKEKILNVELTKHNNVSSVSGDAIWMQITQLNNITLEKQQISNRIQMQEIKELRFEIAQNSRRISDCALKIENLVKEMTTIELSSEQLNKNESTHPDLDLVKNMNLILITLIVTFCLYKGYKFVKSDGRRFTRYNTTNTLHTNLEMDTHSNK